MKKVLVSLPEGIFQLVRNLKGKLGESDSEVISARAKLLIKNASFGHANAMLRFACEEIAKVHVCWLTSEKIIPIDNKVVQDVFLWHKTKNSIILSMLWGFAFLGIIAYGNNWLRGILNHQMKM